MNKFKFEISSKNYEFQSSKSTIYLFIINWNDYNFYTLYEAIYVDEIGGRYELGTIRIARYNQEEKERLFDYGFIFESLGAEYFSVGVSEQYYKNLNNLGPEFRNKVLGALNDIAKFPGIFDEAINEKVTKYSLFRGISPLTVAGRFRRLAAGDNELEKYNFYFTLPVGKNNSSGYSLDFNVDPNSNPPSNIHTIIGRNGVGKTFVLENIIDTLLEEKGKYLGSTSMDKNQSFHSIFANLISVSFSAFDETKPKSERRNKLDKLQYTYIGLKQVDSKKGPKSTTILKNEFVRSLELCQKSKKQQWKRAIKLLESDPNFKDFDISSLIEVENNIELKTEATSVFRKLSSGHKVILLTVTRLVEVLQEKSLVLIDEPEAHLHPPLLSAFIRALSEMLTLTNGVAIIATHSPVILQEVPKNCAWKLRRFGSESKAERPTIETFGENVSILTHEVFQLEVTQSGFYNVINQVAEHCGSYKEALDFFDGKLGHEGRAILLSYYNYKIG